MAAYLKAPQQWNRYAYVANNPLKYIDPTGELLELTGATEEERKAAFERIKAMVGKEEAKHLFVGVAYDSDRKARYFVNSGSKFGATSKLANYLDQLIQGSNTVEYKIADRFTTKSGSSLSTAESACGGACTVGAEESVTGNTQIFVNENSGAISEGYFNSPLIRGAFSGSGRVWSEDDIVDVHEFGHAYANAVEGKRIGNSSDANPRAWEFENLQRATYPTRRKFTRIKE